MGSGFSSERLAAWAALLLDPRRIALVYVALAAMAVTIMAAILPPFAAPDEFTHFFRAESLSGGQVVPWPGPDGIIGAEVDRAALQLFGILDPVAGAAAATPPEKIAAIRALRWDGTAIFMTFPNTGQYGPILYAPHALALVAGRCLGLSVLHSYDLARVLGALSAVLVAALGIALAGRGALATAIVLSTPMFLFIATSVSQDGLLIAVSALFAACTARSRLSGAAGPVRIAWLCALAIALGRPPYALFALLLMRRRGDRSWARWLGAADGPLAPVLLLGLVLVWLTVVGALHQPSFANVPGVEPAAQLDALLQHPGKVLSIARETLANGEFEQKLEEVVGVLGTLNILLPVEDYHLGTAALLLAAATCLLLRPAPRLLFNGAAALVFALVIGAIYAALYLTWTPLGNAAVQGSQGRYFLPLLVCAPLLLPALLPARWGARPRPATAGAGLAGLTGWGLMIAVTVDAIRVLCGAYGPFLAGGW